MRQKIALAVAGLAAAASFAPLSTASAACLNTYYQVTGDCSPCDELGYVITPAFEAIGQEHFLQCIA